MSFSSALRMRGSFISSPCAITSLRCGAAVVLACGGLLGTSLSASELAPSPATVRFTGPEVVRLDWNTRCPRVADFDGDGLMDLAVLNLDRSRVEFLLQTKGGPKEAAAAPNSRKDIWNPVLEVSRFRKEALVTGESMYALVAGDWNGDGRADVAYTTDGKRLTLRTQGKDMVDWTQKKEFLLDSVAYDADSLLATDLNGDKRADLALLTKTRLMVCLQGEKGAWQEPRNYALTQEGCAGLRAADLNGDGRTDLFCTSEEADALLVRLQSKDGGFGEEWRLEIPSGESWMTPVHLGKETSLAWLQAGTEMVELARLKNATVADADRAASVRHAIPPSDSKTGAAVFGDITGDGVDDAVLAEPKRARVWLFAGRSDGGFEEGKEYPSLSGIEGMSLADVDADGKFELVILSPAEKSIALARWDVEKGRLAYPEVVHESEEAITAMTTGRLGEGKETVVLCARESKPKNSLVALAWSAKEKKLTPSTLDIPGLVAKPNALRILDADQDGRGDIAVFASLSNMQLHLSQADAKTPFKKVEGIPDNLTSRLQPIALSQADIDGDGKTELIAAKDQLARAIRIDASGRAKVVEQFNAPDSSAQLSCAVVLPGKEGSEKKVLLFDSASSQLHELAVNADGVYRVRRSRKIHATALEDVRLLGKTGDRGLLLLGKQSFDVLPLEGRTVKLETIASFTTELKDTNPADLMAARFTGGDADDLMLLDTQQSRVAEFFRTKGADHHDWQSFLYFRIFQADPHYRGKTGFDAEPHDYTAADLNGDGRADLCLLVHDRLLLYVQE